MVFRRSSCGFSLLPIRISTDVRPRRCPDMRNRSTAWLRLAGISLLRPERHATSVNHHRGDRCQTIDKLMIWHPYDACVKVQRMLTTASASLHRHQNYGDGARFASLREGRGSGIISPLWEGLERGSLLHSTFGTPPLAPPHKGEGNHAPGTTPFGSARQWPAIAPAVVIQTSVRGPRCGSARGGGAAAGTAGRRYRRAVRCPSPAMRRSTAPASRRSCRRSCRRIRDAPTFRRTIAGMSLSSCG